MSVKYLCPDSNPPSREDYDELYAQFIAVILATGKTAVTVSHAIKHPLTTGPGVLVVEKQVDSAYTTYIVTKAP